MHVLDVHWYPEARGTKRITEKDTSPKTVAARLQAPRSLWDPTYTEKSWITGTWGKPIRLIPWLLERIAERYPGTKLAMTEYNFGAGDHISGGLAQADVLGIFGREGLYLGNYWGDGPGNGNAADVHQGRLQAVPELRRQEEHVRRHGGRGDAGRHREGVDLRGHRYEAEGRADDPRHQQRAALDLQRQDRHQGRQVRQGAGLHARRQQPRHQAAGARRREGRRSSTTSCRPCRPRCSSAAGERGPARRLAAARV